MKYKDIEKLDLVNDCLKITDKKGKEKIISYLLNLDKNINKELAKELLNPPSTLTQTALIRFLQEKVK